MNPVSKRCSCTSHCIIVVTPAIEGVFASVLNKSTDCVPRHFGINRMFLALIVRLQNR